MREFRIIIIIIVYEIFKIMTTNPRRSEARKSRNILLNVYRAFS